MSEIQQPPNEKVLPQQMQADDTINLLDYIEVIVKRWKMIAKVTAVAFVISIIVAFLLPKVYSSTAMILPPQQDQGLMSMMMSQMGGGALSSLAGSVLGTGTPADQYVSILQSNRIEGAIIDRFKLMKEYGIDYRLDMYKKMDKIVDISAGKKDGIISITVEDEDPKRAAAIANAYVDELEKLTLKLSTSGAGQNRAFLEDRLAKAKVDLTKAEDALKAFQSKNKAVDVPDQAQASIQGIAQLSAQLAVQEAQLSALRSRFTDNTQEVMDMKATVGNIRGQIARLEGNGKGSSIPSMGTVPALGQQYLRLMREFKIQETLVELLTKQYEVAKLTEANDVANIQVIQRAEVPDKKVKPKRGMIVLASTFAAGLMAVLFAFIRDFALRMPEEDRQRWNNIRWLIRVRRT